MPVSKVVGIDHISIRVSDYQKSKAFYSKLFEFLGFEISDEYPGTIGWTNGKTRYWIAGAEGRKKYKIGDVGPAPLRLPAAQPPRRRCPAGLSRKAGRAHRRSG
jgi:catechol 2,3-dioxygenase-like lactoylglutathione lyase family enzyme